jgi:hypothetical protein
MNVVCVAYTVPSGLQRGAAGGDQTRRRLLPSLDTSCLPLTLLLCQSL